MVKSVIELSFFSLPWTEDPTILWILMRTEEMLDLLFLDFVISLKFRDFILFDLTEWLDSHVILQVRPVHLLNNFLRIGMNFYHWLLEVLDNIVRVDNLSFGTRFLGRIFKKELWHCPPFICGFETGVPSLSELRLLSNLH